MNLLWQRFNSDAPASAISGWLNLAHRIENAFFVTGSMWLALLTTPATQCEKTQL